MWDGRQPCRTGLTFPVSTALRVPAPTMRVVTGKGVDSSHDGSRTTQPSNTSGSTISAIAATIAGSGSGPSGPSAMKISGRKVREG